MRDVLAFLGEVGVKGAVPREVLVAPRAMDLARGIPLPVTVSAGESADRSRSFYDHADKLP